MSARYEPARILGRIQVVRLECFFRLVRDVHETSPLGAVPKPSRFSDPAGGYSVLYAAESVDCAFWEAIGRGRFTHRKRRRSTCEQSDTRLIAKLKYLFEV